MSATKSTTKTTTKKTKAKNAPAQRNSMGRTATEQAAIDRLESFLVKLMSGEEVASGVGYFPMSYNVATGHEFTGKNKTAALISSMSAGDNRYVSFSEAKQRGWNTRGAKGVPFIRPNTRKIERPDGVEEDRTIWTVFYLFNLADIEHDLGNVPQEGPSNEAEAIANRMLETIPALGAKLVRAASLAHMSPTKAHISLPAESTFKSWELFCSTAIHESSHFVGREDKTVKEYEKYRGFEEVVAECTVVLVMSQLGLPFQPKNGAYIYGWLKEAEKTHKDPLSEALIVAGKRSEIILETYNAQKLRESYAA